MSQTDQVKAVVIRALHELSSQIDEIDGLISLEIRVIFDEKTGRPRKVQTALHTTRLTADRR